MRHTACTRNFVSSETVSQNSHLFLWASWNYWMKIGSLLHQIPEIFFRGWKKKGSPKKKKDKSKRRVILIQWPDDISHNFNSSSTKYNNHLQLIEHQTNPKSTTMINQTSTSDPQILVKANPYNISPHRSLNQALVWSTSESTSHWLIYTPPWIDPLLNQPLPRSFCY